MDSETLHAFYRTIDTIEDEATETAYMVAPEDPSLAQVTYGDLARTADRVYVELGIVPPALERPTEVAYYACRRLLQGFALSLEATSGEPTSGGL